jgi:hypothetical protein
VGTGLSVRENRSVEGEAEIVCNVFVAALPRRDSAFARATEEYVAPISRAQKLRIAQQTLFIRKHPTSGTQFQERQVRRQQHGNDGNDERQCDDELRRELGTRRGVRRGGLVCRCFARHEEKSPALAGLFASIMPKYNAGNSST